VAFTYPWVRPPLEVYRLVPVTASDGVDVSYRMHVGDVTNSAQVNYGKSSQTLPGGGGTVEAKRAWGVSYTAEYHAATLHIAYQRPHLTLESVKPIFDGFRQFGEEGITLADKYDVNNKPLSIIAVGTTYDPGHWFVMAEWSHTKIQSFIGNNTGWYVSGGYRLGKFTPYLTYAQAKSDNLSDPGLNLSTLPPPLVGPAIGLNAALNSLLSKKTVQNTLSVGGRWDFMRNADLKLQFDHTRIGAGSPGVLSNTQPGFQPGGKVNVFSATIDFVF
jgi:predicted porin